MFRIEKDTWVAKTVSVDFAEREITEVDEGGLNITA